MWCGAKGETIRQIITNERIRARQVRVIEESGNSLGIMDLPSALRMANERGLDLILVSPNASPPVCRLGDIGKYKYELSKKEKEARKTQRAGAVKEVKLSSKIAAHDFAVRAAKADELLKKGHKVKVSLFFRGREITHSNLGRKVMEQMIEALKEVGRVEMPPKMEGKIMSMLLVPQK